MSVKLLTEYQFAFLSLKGGFTGSSESTLVQMSNCWKSHATAYMIIYTFRVEVKHEHRKNNFRVTYVKSVEVIIGNNLTVTLAPHNDLLVSSTRCFNFVM